MKVRALISIAIIAIAASAAAKDKHAPLSPKIMAAKSVYIRNTAQSQIADRAFDALTKWGRFQVVDSPDKADLTLIFSTSETPGESGTTSHYDQSTGKWSYGTVSVAGSGSTHLEIVDTAGESLYSDTRPWSWRSATKQMVGDLRKRIEEQEKH